MQQAKYTVRVYGFILNEQNQVLIADEYHFDTPMTKLPGGGMELGEGTLDCLKREAIEELGQEIEVGEHLYTTDFYQEFIFHKQYQLLSIYYIARFTEAPRFKVSVKKHDFERVNGSISFRFVPAGEISPEMFTWPTDKMAAKVFCTKLHDMSSV